MGLIPEEQLCFLCPAPQSGSAGRASSQNLVEGKPG